MPFFARLVAASYWVTFGGVAFGGLVALASVESGNSKELVFLSTPTTRDSGILRALTDAFAKKSNLAVKLIVGSSDQILKQGSRGEGDVLLTHSPEAERAWMAEGNGTSRRLVMYRDFVIVGPANDPAKIRGLRVTDALKRISDSKAPFVSRGDQSGTHMRELAMWKQAGIEPKGQAWYRETGQGQGLTMELASQLGAYTLTDRATYQVLALVLVRRIALRILVQNDAGLYNIYHVMPVNAAKFPRVNQSAGQAFADWIVSADGQALISRFGQKEFGRSMFVPAADKREDDLL